VFLRSRQSSIVSKLLSSTVFDDKDCLHTHTHTHTVPENQ